MQNSLDQERRSRVSAENGLRETNSQLSGARRELHELKQNQGHKDQHCQSLQESVGTRTYSILVYGSRGYRKQYFLGSLHWPAHLNHLILDMYDA